jgi:hypothetical protein
MTPFDEPSPPIGDNTSHFTAAGGSSSPLLRGLNAEQLAAVTAPAGSRLVLAQ